jgi:hypothetical protein
MMCSLAALQPLKAGNQPYVMALTDLVDQASSSSTILYLFHQTTSFQTHWEILLRSEFSGFNFDYYYHFPLLDLLPLLVIFDLQN